MKSYSYKATMAGAARRGSLLPEKKPPADYKKAVQEVRRRHAVNATMDSVRIASMRARFPQGARKDVVDFERVDRVIRRFVKAYGISRRQLMSRDKSWHIYPCRHALAYWLARSFKLNAGEVGSILRIDRTSVFNAVDAYCDRRNMAGLHRIDFKPFLRVKRPKTEPEMPRGYQNYSVTEGFRAVARKNGRASPDQGELGGGLWPVARVKPPSDG